VLSLYTAFLLRAIQLAKKEAKTILNYYILMYRGKCGSNVQVVSGDKD
jgi:hypothetical protein